VEAEAQRRQRRRHRLEELRLPPLFRHFHRRPPQFAGRGGTGPTAPDLAQSILDPNAVVSVQNRYGTSA